MRSLDFDTRTLLDKFSAKIINTLLRFKTPSRRVGSHFSSTATIPPLRVSSQQPSLVRGYGECSSIQKALVDLLTRSRCDLSSCSSVVHAHTTTTDVHRLLRRVPGCKSRIRTEHEGCKRNLPGGASGARRVDSHRSSAPLGQNNHVLLMYSLPCPCP